jgi:hypothetical protein
MLEHTMRIIATSVALAAAGIPAFAQSDIDPDNKYAWAENIGFMNWADAEAGAAGVRVEPGYLAGWIWSENVGWICVGNGSPAAGGRYGNETGEDYGVNIEPWGDLAGLAWGENIGWINFDTAAALGAHGQQARFDGDRFRGYAWGANIGWINLDDARIFVAVAGGGGGACTADCDGSGGLDFFDFLCFQNRFAAGDPAADCDGSGQLDFFDFLCFQNDFAAGCP